MIPQERHQSHENTRRAEPALQPVGFVKRGLQGMQRIAVRETFDGRDSVSVRLDREHET